jgi:cyclase
MPVLLLRGDGLVKGIKFINHTYVGDPMNAIHIFNEKEVDELVFLDITATQENKAPRLEYIAKIADECFMPFAVGGGIKNVKQIREILFAGAEKVSINTSAVENPTLISEAANLFGSQSVVVSIDYKKTWPDSKWVFTYSGTKNTKLDPIEWAVRVAELGAGEILLNSMDRDGSMEGYDIETIAQVSSAVNVPVIACGGAGNIEHLGEAVRSGASALAAGSMFVFHGRKRAVLISYPTQKELERVFDQG